MVQAVNKPRLPYLLAFDRMVALWIVTSSKVTGVVSMTTPRLLTKVRQASTR